MLLVLQIIVSENVLDEIKSRNSNESAFFATKKNIFFANHNKIYIYIYIYNFCLIANCVICLLQESGGWVLVW